MKHYGPIIPLARRQQGQPDDSLKAAVADLLDALELARRERDRARATVTRLWGPPWGGCKAVSSAWSAATAICGAWPA